MWDQNDVQGFQYWTPKQIGQINLDSNLGKLIYEISKQEDIKFILEIGTWNGFGSTKCIVEAIKDQKEKHFVSLECNLEKLNFARSYYTSNYNTQEPLIELLNLTVLNKIPTSEELFNQFPTLQNDSTKMHWLNVDLENLKNCGIYNVEKEIDLLVLDGGEFTTYFEYAILKDKCKNIILDDTIIDKCSQIRKELIEDERWELVKEDQKDRNGWSYFKLKQ
jgi:hypothetical protein